MIKSQRNHTEKSNLNAESKGKGIDEIIRQNAFVQSNDIALFKV